MAFPEGVFFVYFVLSFLQRSANLIQKIAQLVGKGAVGQFGRGSS